MPGEFSNVPFPWGFTIVCVVRGNVKIVGSGGVLPQGPDFLADRGTPLRYSCSMFPQTGAVPAACVIGIKFLHDVSPFSVHGSVTGSVCDFGWLQPERLTVNRIKLTGIDIE